MEDMEFQLMAPLLGEDGYVIWIMRMKLYLQELRYDIQLSVENEYTPPKSIPKGSAAKKLHRDNSKVIRAIMSGLSDSDKNKVGQCLTVKDIWNKVQSLYSNESLLTTIRVDQGGKENQ